MKLKGHRFVDSDEMIKNATKQLKEGPLKKCFEQSYERWKKCVGVRGKGSSCAGAHSTTPTAALQIIEDIIPLHIKAEQEATYVITARLCKKFNYNNINFNPNNYEDGTTSTKFHPAIFQLEDRISLKKQFLPVPGLNIYTDGSKMEDKTGSAFCVMEEDTTKYEWMAQLRPFNTVFQAELLAIQEACLWASMTKQQVKSIIRWQKEWDNGETGRSGYNVLPKVKTAPTPWQRSEIMVHFRHTLNDSKSETAIPVVAETWETPYTMLQAACLQHHTT
ncbi:hypothetical protein AVEN_139294-1 [Araneus ventricosus]|uniref:RNase H type-1 domain-containing protein n=1 Tax=Araneus ventricosus TaxID=182803 RepID=A0A4Y2RAK8_ARAVE|nr:hypothetical protein AVEN_72767-1 [Araneus ventricosus]GBN72797.1 hypothetical protein AVEN_139294-1 [Araneus ventricosus]